MSAFAKKMMEKYGWKEGEGLGKEKSGVKTYVKVVRRDPRTATGLGHAADPQEGGGMASQCAVELDSIYGELRREKQSAKVDIAHEDDISDDESRNEGIPMRHITTLKQPARAKRLRGDSPSDARESSTDSSDTSSSSSGDDGAPPVGDIVRMSDAELLRRCGGVRLGRAGRHRYFDGKLTRIAESHGEELRKRQKGCP